MDKRFRKSNKPIQQEHKYTFAELLSKGDVNDKDMIKSLSLKDVIEIFEQASRKGKECICIYLKLPYTWCNEDKVLIDHKIYDKMFYVTFASIMKFYNFVKSNDNFIDYISYDEIECVEE